MDRYSYLKVLTLLGWVVLVPWALASGLQFYASSADERTALYLAIGIGASWALAVARRISTRAARKAWAEAPDARPRSSSERVLIVLGFVLVLLALGAGLYRAFPDARITSTIQDEARRLPGVTSVVPITNPSRAGDAHLQGLEAPSTASLADMCSRSSTGISDGYPTQGLLRDDRDIDDQRTSRYCSWSTTVRDVSLRFIAVETGTTTRVDVEGTLH